MDLQLSIPLHTSTQADHCSQAKSSCPLKTCYCFVVTVAERVSPMPALGFSSNFDVLTQPKRKLKQTAKITLTPHAYLSGIFPSLLHVIITKRFILVTGCKELKIF